MREFFVLLARQLKPKFHELSAYLIAFTCCWLFVFHTQLRQALLMIFSGFGSLSPYFILVGLLLTLGVLFSLVNAFIQRKKSSYEKYLMGWFVMGVSSLASFAVGVEMLPLRASPMLILPVWNMLIGVLMLFQMGFQKYDVGDEDASPQAVWATTAILLVILFLADWGLQLSWAVILSLCIFYATTVVFVVSWFIRYFRIQLTDEESGA